MQVKPIKDERIDASRRILNQEREVVEIGPKFTSNFTPQKLSGKDLWRNSQNIAENIDTEFTQEESMIDIFKRKSLPRK